MPIQVVSADFNKTATRPAEWPRGLIPELAFVGRSNVGQVVDAERAGAPEGAGAGLGHARPHARAPVLRRLYRPTPAARPRSLRFCDLPGYGYAKVSKDERDRWAAMIEDYLRERDVLRAVVLIVDARHPPTESDEDAATFLRAAGRRVVVAATKMDKLPKSRGGGGAPGGGAGARRRARRRGAVLGGRGDRAPTNCGAGWPPWRRRSRHFPAEAGPGAADRRRTVGPRRRGPPSSVAERLRPRGKSRRRGVASHSRRRAWDPASRWGPDRPCRAGRGRRAPLPKR